MTLPLTEMAGLLSLLLGRHGGGLSRNHTGLGGGADRGLGALEEANLLLKGGDAFLALVDDLGLLADELGLFVDLFALLLVLVFEHTIFVFELGNVLKGQIKCWKLHSHNLRRPKTHLGSLL